MNIVAPWSAPSARFRGVARVGLVGLALNWTASGCATETGSNESCQHGTEGCICYNGVQCVAGLQCVSGFCINPTTGDGDPTTGDGDPTTGDGDPTTGDGDPTTGGPTDDWNPCLALIECVKTVEPSAVSTLAQLYGVEGSCYEIAGLTKEDCWAECEAIRQQYAGSNLHPECAHFQCNDGVLDATEMCDWDENGCNAHCELTQHECNPLTQVPCGDNQRCRIGVKEYFDPFSDPGYFYRFQYQCWGWQEGTAGMNEACESLTQNDCAIKVSECLNSETFTKCNASACCAQYCYLGVTSVAHANCPTGYECVPVTTAIQGYEWLPGMEDMGLCL